jgi:ribosome-binding protein aMBF1 (putative translation factor)
MKCDACENEIIGRPNKIECCKALKLCERCASVELVKETDNFSEMCSIIRLSLKEAKKKAKRK